MLLLTTVIKSYMGSQISHLDLTLHDLKQSKSWSLRFWSLISHKVAALSHKLMLSTNSKSYMESQAHLHICP